MLHKYGTLAGTFLRVNQHTQWFPHENAFPTFFKRQLAGLLVTLVIANSRSCGNKFAAVINSNASFLALKFWNYVHSITKILSLNFNQIVNWKFLYVTRIFTNWWNLIDKRAAIRGWLWSPTRREERERQG